MGAHSARKLGDSALVLYESDSVLSTEEARAEMMAELLRSGAHGCLDGMRQALAGVPDMHAAAASRLDIKEAVVSVPMGIGRLPLHSCGETTECGNE